MSSKINGFDVVALLHDHPDAGLTAGQTGTVVSVHDDGVAFEVEFPVEARRSVVETVEAKDLLKLLNLGIRRRPGGVSGQ